MNSKLLQPADLPLVQMESQLQVTPDPPGRY